LLSKEKKSECLFQQDKQLLFIFLHSVTFLGNMILALLAHQEVEFYQLSFTLLKQVVPKVGLT